MVQQGVSMARSKSSQRWLQEHHADDYVKKSRQEALRSRAVYKLAEIDERDRLIGPDSCVVELGAAPGGWTEYVAARLGRNGFLLAVDVLPMEPVEGATILQGDFTELEVLDQVRRAIGGRSVDLVLSDMAPNFTGQSAVDQPRSVYLAELALEMCDEVLSDSGVLLVKTFQGVGFEMLLAQMRKSFSSVKTRKPSASRSRSREVYILAKR